MTVLLPRLSFLSRLLAGVLGLLALATVALFAAEPLLWDRGWRAVRWKPVLTCGPLGLLFVYAAIVGRSPRWLENVGRRWLGGGGFAQRGGSAAEETGSPRPPAA